MMSKIFSYNQDRKGVFVGAIALSFFLGLTIPVMSYLTAQLYFALALINNYSLIGIEPLAQSQTDEGFSKRQTTLIIFLGFAGVYFVVYLLQVITSYTVGSEVTRNLREKLYAKFLRMPVSWFERSENNPGMLSAALGQDCETVNELASMLLFIVIIIVTGIASCYIVGFIFNWKITLLGLGFLPFVLFCALYKSHLQSELNKVK
jgi:ABC-type multidrug transport system fused ATPase/permease subunit